jgi:hypothetical protein
MYRPLKVLTAISVRTFGISTRPYMLRKPCAYQHIGTLYTIQYVRIIHGDFHRSVSNRAPLQGLLMATNTVSWHGLYQRDVMRLET